MCYCRHPTRGQDAQTEDEDGSPQPHVGCSRAIAFLFLHCFNKFIFKSIFYSFAGSLICLKNMEDTKLGS